MKRAVLLSFLAAASALAQQPSEQNASISGVVKDSVAGQPLANYNVSTYLNVTYLNDTLIQSPTTKQVNAVTDEQGRYKLSDLPPGPYRLTARNAQAPGFLYVTRQVMMAGRDVGQIDFNFELPGSITGRVFDENREPVPNLGVRLISREYYGGTLGYFIKSVTVTDDRGIFAFKNVQAGHPYMLMAEKNTGRFPTPRSDVPLDPKLRRRVPMRTFYPNSPDRQGAEVITLRPGETREGINIAVKKSLSFCIEGTVAGFSGPAALPFGIEPTQPAYGTSSTGGLFAVSPGATAGPDGKFRVCELPAGSYRLSAYDRPDGDPNRALMLVDVTDRDVHNVNISIGAGFPLNGEVVWEGAAPETPVTTKLSLSLTPLLRTMVANERPSTRADIPGTFSIAGMLHSDYAVRSSINAPGLYIKEITYAGQNVLNEPLRFGSATGDAGLRIVVGRDGATVTARVQDKDGNPLSDVRVLVMPASVPSEAALQATLVNGQTDQAGRYKSHTLRPGKYLVVATSDKVDPTPESIDNLWRSRNRFQEVELPANGSAEVKLTPVSLR